jgi:hypothetical protein
VEGQLGETTGGHPSRETGAAPQADEDENQTDRRESGGESSATPRRPESNAAASVEAENGEAAGGETGADLNGRANLDVHDPTDPDADDRRSPTAHHRTNPDAEDRTDDPRGQWRRRGARADHKTA